MAQQERSESGTMVERADNFFVSVQRQDLEDMGAASAIPELLNKEGARSGIWRYKSFNELVGR